MGRRRSASGFIWIVKSGRVDGPRFKGDVLPGSGDWSLVRADGVVQLDVRASIKTRDGALVYAIYSGFIHFPSADVFSHIMQGQDVPLDEYYFYTNPTFRTGTEQYAWPEPQYCRGSWPDSARHGGLPGLECVVGEAKKLSMSEYRKPKLEHLYDMHADLEPPQVVGASPLGMRQIFIVKGGTVEGPRVKGEILPGGGDWALIRSDGAVQLDVRATLRTDDGALIYATYNDLIIATPEIFGRLLHAQDVPLNEYYFYINPMFQTATPQYQWLNRLIAIGRGKVVPGAVEYRVWAVTQ